MFIFDIRSVVVYATLHFSSFNFAHFGSIFPIVHGTFRLGHLRIRQAISFTSSENANHHHWTLQDFNFTYSAPFG